MQKPREEHVVGILENSREASVAREEQERQGGMTEVRQNDNKGSDYVGPW